MTKHINHICYYHNDLDGICSAAIIKKKIPDCTCIKVGYDLKTAVDARKIIDANFDLKVFVVDFSFDEKTMKEFADTGNLVWIDHHEGAQKKMPKLWADSNIKGLRETRSGACLLTWEYMYPDKGTPMAVHYISDVDMWTFSIVSSRNFFEGLFIETEFPEDKIWNSLLEPKDKEYHKLMEDMISSGSILMKAKAMRVKRTFDEGFNAVFEKHMARVVNTNHDISDVGEYIYNNGYEIAYMWKVSNNQIVVGLRSEIVDVGAIARKYGGGGHKFASGFEVPLKEGSLPHKGRL